MAKKKTPKIALVDGDDWQGLYVDGKLLQQGHVISSDDILKATGIDYDYIFADIDWLGERGDLPDNLNEVKKEEE